MALRQWVRRWLERNGYRLNRIPKTWAPWGGRLTRVDDREFAEIYEGAERDPSYRSRIKDETTSKICRCWMLKSLLETMLPIEHDVAECGVNRGLSAYVLASYLRKAGFGGEKEFQLYDSFEGLPASDATLNDVAMARPGLYATPYEHVAAHLGEFPFVRIHAGWIPASLAPAENRTFSFVHLDLNVYEAYRDALDFFWPRLASPGLVVCDDYGFTGSRGAMRAVDEFGVGRGVKVVYLPTGQAALWKYR
jgi:O-methyltransferase